MDPREDAPRIDVSVDAWAGAAIASSELALHNDADNNGMPVRAQSTNGRTAARIHRSQLSDQLRSRFAGLRAASAAVEHLPGLHRATVSADHQTRMALLNLLEDTKACRLATERQCAERRHREQELHRLEGRYRLLLESIANGFFIVEQIDPGNGEAADFHIVEANPAFHIQCGAGSVTGKSLRQVFKTDAEEWYANIGRALDTGSSVRFESQLVMQGRTVNISAFPMRGSVPSGVGVIVKDSSQHNAAEQAMRDADRRKTEHLTTVAHELRNPLAAVLTGIHLLRLSSSHDSEFKSIHDSMERQILHMVRLVDDLLDASRVNHGKVELKRGICELSTILRRAMEISRPLIKESKHELHISIPGDPIPLYVDDVKLCQVFVNLLNNAAKYTDEGGKIWLRAGQLDKEVIISVKDNGIGIDASQLSTIFDMFTQVSGSPTRRDSGLGIGLALAKSLVEMHGGTVSAFSVGLGEGSEFIVRLPLQRA
jgi:signal transduction histidine kinase